MNAAQFAWLYLIENGLAGVERSYYGGYDVVDTRATDVEKFYCSTSVIENINKKYLKDIKRYGVDWKKTLAPRSSFESEFQGTFCDSKEVEFLKGTIVLNNNRKQSWIAEAIPITNVFEMMVQASAGESKFKEIFGETK